MTDFFGFSFLHSSLIYFHMVHFWKELRCLIFCYLTKRFYLHSIIQGQPEPTSVLTLLVWILQHHQYNSLLIVYFCSDCVTCSFLITVASDYYFSVIIPGSSIATLRVYESCHQIHRLSASPIIF